MEGSCESGNEHLQYLLQTVEQCLYLLLILLRCVSATGLGHLQEPHKFIDVCSLCASLCGRDATVYLSVD